MTASTRLLDRGNPLAWLSAVAGTVLTVVLAVTLLSTPARAVEAEDPYGYAEVDAAGDADADVVAVSVQGDAEGTVAVAPQGEAYGSFMVSCGPDVTVWWAGFGTGYGTALCLS